MHCHVVPRFAGEDPRKPIDMAEQEVLLSEPDYAQRIEALWRALESRG